MEHANTYELAKTIVEPDWTIRVYSPILSDEEKNQRMQQIHDAAARLLRAPR